MSLLFCFHKTDSEIHEIVNKAQLQNILWKDITKAVDINHTTIELAETSEEHTVVLTIPKILYLLRFKL